MTEVVKRTPAVVDDGWDGETEEDRSGIIRGGKLKFTNESEWVCDGDVISPGREFLALENGKMLQKWVPWSKGPVETIPVAHGSPWPDVDKMNDEAPRDEWQEKFGQLKGPWQKTRVLYLLDPVTAQPFTYIATTIGGRRAVRELRENTRLARKLWSAPLLAVVTLGNTFMPNQYGGRQRPDFPVQRYVEMGGSEPKQLVHAGPDDKPKQGNGGALADIAEAKPKAKAKRTTKASDVQTSFLDDPDEWGEDDLRIQAEADAVFEPDVA